MKRLSLVAALLMAAAAMPASAEDAPGVFKVPGTDSTIKFYGYVQLDGTLDFSGRVGNIEGIDWATALPGVPNDDSPEAKRRGGQLYLTARTSRFGIQTSTPSDMGPIGARLEADFNGPNGDQSETYTNSVVFRLRHAYGTIGNLLVGQTWTTFLDFGGAPETVDFNGPGSLALVRNPMVRYTFGLAPGMTLAVAAENARGSQFGGAKYQTLPDFHVNYGYSAAWGSLSARIVTQQYNVATGADTASKSAFSVAGAVSGQVKAGAKDTIQAQLAGGPGIGRYLLNAFGAVQNLPGSDPAAIGGNPGAFRIEANGDLKLINVIGYHAGLTHVWNPKIRSNVVWSQTFISDPKVDGAPAGVETQKMLSQAFVNSFFTLSKTTEVGVEYVWGQWKSFGSPDATGTQNRINASFHYNFF